MLIKSKNIHGFTLIELLVTISIILLVTGAGIAGFVRFNDRQQVQTTVNQLKDYMNSAQIKARAGEGADSCTSPGKLYGYRVATDVNKVYLRKICREPENITNVTNNELRSDFDLNNVTVVKNPNTNITFIALKGGIDMGNNTSVIYTVTGKYATDIIYEFEVFSTGEISEGDFL